MRVVCFREPESILFMMRYKSWTLTDLNGDLWLDSFAVGNDSLHLPTTHDWLIRKRTLRGELRDGVDLIEVHNGALSFSVLPTRGMGLCAASTTVCRWAGASPAVGPVHPKYVRLQDRGGLGWLDGFDELLCAAACPPTGRRARMSGPTSMGTATAPPCPLHGRVANLPANRVEVRVNLDPPYELSVTGEVDESALFCPQLRLTATCTTVPGSNRLVIHDVVENCSAQPAELQLLYHCNFGPPFLEAGGRVLVPIREVAPRSARPRASTPSTPMGRPPSATASRSTSTIRRATRSQTLAALVNAERRALRGAGYGTEELPCFTLWKNTAALEDDFVTGLEPATNYPNFKSFERQQRRVRVLPPGGRWEARLTIEVHDTHAGVTAVQTEIARVQALTKSTIHRTPQPRYSPGG